MKRTVWTSRLMRAMGFALAMGFIASSTAWAQSDRARVLVIPLVAQPGAPPAFGEKIAKQVQDELKEFPTLTSVEDGEVKSALKQYKLDKDELSLIQWRQLASRLDASLIMYGTLRPAGGAKTYNVDVAFVDTRTGDSLPVPQFTVAGDGRDEVKEASGQIVQALGSQVDFRRAVLFCQEYLAATQYDDAQRNCAQALEINPTSLQALYLMGRVMIGREEWEQAVEYLQQVVERSPSNTEALQALAFAHVKLGNTEVAMAYYREFLNFNPGAEDVRLTVAYNLGQAEAYGEAIILLQEGIAEDSTSVALWKYLGDMALKKATDSDDTENDATSSGSVVDEEAARVAVDAYEHLLVLVGDSIEVGTLKNTIAAYMALDEVEAAIDFSDRALEKVPGDASLWSVRADALARAERYADAIAAMDQVLALQADYQNAQLRRGMFKLRQGDESGAVTDFRAAIAAGSDPDQIANQLLARGYQDYFQKAQYAAAIDMFTTGLEFANSADMRRQLSFFVGASHFQRGVALDESNSAEGCAPAQRALSSFQSVLPYMEQAGNYQSANKAQIIESTDVYIYRQQQIIRKACG